MNGIVVLEGTTVSNIVATGEPLTFIAIVTIEGAAPSELVKEPEKVKYPIPVAGEV